MTTVGMKSEQDMFAVLDALCVKHGLPRPLIGAVAGEYTCELLAAVLLRLEPMLDTEQESRHDADR